MNSANWRRLCPASFARRLRPPPLGGRRQLVFSGDSVAGQLFAGFACELAPAERAAVAWQPFDLFHAPLAPRLITARPAGSVFVILAGTWFRVEQMDAYEAAIAQMLRTLRAHPTHNFLVLSIAAQHWRGGKYSDAARPTSASSARTPSRAATSAAPRPSPSTSVASSVSCARRP